MSVIDNEFNDLRLDCKGKLLREECAINRDGFDRRMNWHECCESV